MPALVKTKLPYWLSFFSTLVCLSLIGWYAWRSIPPRQIIFTADEMAINRLTVGVAGFVSPPVSISSGYSTVGGRLRLPPGGVIRYDTAGLNDGLLQGTLQAVGPGSVAIEIRAEGPQGSTVLLERTLAPAKLIIDQLQVTFLLNPAELPPGTERILFMVRPDSVGSVDWTEAGTVSRSQNPALGILPLPWVRCVGFQRPGLDASHQMIMLHSPSRLILRVPAGHFRLSFRYGFNPAVFKDPKADSDGIGIRATLQTADGSSVLLNRLLQPRFQESDRQLQSADLALTGPGLLQLEATPGPGENIAWDWSVLRDFRLAPVDR